MSTLDPTRCPRCGQANDCAQACAAGGDCWCFGQPIDPALIKALPVAAQGKTCLCRSCAVEGLDAGQPTNRPER